MIEQDGHQYIEIGYYFAHLMLHAQALNILEEGKMTPAGASPAASTPGGVARDEQRKKHMTAMRQLSTNIFQRARRVEVSEIRVLHSFIVPNLSMSPILFTSSSLLLEFHSVAYFR
jgi:hypothetical protein